MEGYRTLSSRSIHGTLGLITVQGDVYLCVVSVSEKVASVRAGETVQRIKAVEFRTSTGYTLYFTDAFANGLRLLKSS